MGFANAFGAIECKLCTKGKYGHAAHDTGTSKHCVQCPAGKFQEVDGSTHCVECESGKYVNAAGFPACLTCPLGQWTHGKAGQPHCDWPAVVCKVTDYGQWLGCTKSCGGGVNTRYRKALHEMVFYGPYRPHFDAEVEKLEDGNAFASALAQPDQAALDAVAASAATDAASHQAALDWASGLPADIVSQIGGGSGGSPPSESVVNAVSGVAAAPDSMPFDGAGFSDINPALLMSMTGGAPNLDEEVHLVPERPRDAPVITILGKNPVRVEESNSGDYQDMSAVCQDKIDGDISNHLEIKGKVINMAEPGTYKIKYMCKNSHGLEAHTKIHDVCLHDQAALMCHPTRPSTAARSSRVENFNAQMSLPTARHLSKITHATLLLAQLIVRFQNGVGLALAHAVVAQASATARALLTYTPRMEARCARPSLTCKRATRMRAPLTANLRIGLHGPLVHAHAAAVRSNAFVALMFMRLMAVCRARTRTNHRIATHMRVLWIAT